MSLASEDLLAKIKGSWEKQPPGRKERIQEIVSHFHFRDLKKYEDGSVGTINISSKQLRDLLAWLSVE